MSEYGCNIEVRERDFVIARFHNKKVLAAFLKGWLPHVIEERGPIDISIKGKEGDWPK